MTQDSGRTLYPQTGFLSHFTKAEQLQLLMTHPLFTGKCPQCGYEFPKVDLPPVNWNCPTCDWDDRRL